MAIQSTSHGPRLEVLPGGRADEPPQTRWRFTPNDRCKESLWQALLSGVFYGTMAHSAYRAIQPSDEELMDIQSSGSAMRRGQLAIKHLLLNPTWTLMGIGMADLVRRGIGGSDRNAALAALRHPIHSFRDVFNNCMDREVISGRELIAGALKQNPLTRIKFQAIPWPEIPGTITHDVGTKEVVGTGLAVVAGFASAVAFVLGVRNIPTMEAAPAGLGATTRPSLFSSDQNSL